MSHTLPTPFKLEYDITPDDTFAQVAESPTVAEILRGLRRQLRVSAATLALIAVVTVILGGVNASLSDPAGEVGQNDAMMVGMTLGIAFILLLLAVTQVFTSFRGASLRKRQAKAVSRYTPTGPHRLTADETAVDVVTETIATRRLWRAFSRIEETESFIALVDHFGNTPIMIPRCALAENAPAFLDFARERINRAPQRASSAP